MRFQDEERAGAGADGGSRRGEQTARACERCGFMTSQRLCKACVLLEGLNRGTPRMALGRQGERLARDAAAATAQSSTPA